MSARSLAWLATAAFALAGWLWLAADAGGPAASVDDAPPAASAVTTAVAIAAAAHAASAPIAAPPRPAAAPEAERASSLAGTDIDGAFTIGDDGRFAPDRQAIRLFDYFLTTEGERDAAAIRAAVLDAARARLSPDDADRALALYDRYLGYRQALQAALESGTTAVGDVDAAVALARRVQIERFGTADAERLFANPLAHP
jgi:hypothetical protein